ncbi:LOW QUALITY PROTEIN: Satratoxin biosynthesis SC0 cluster protein [Paramyrothecium foliicola]|nr:LOW QUALITY PROTEIN: Satratoxin biosynthesis SC0 cluster protein [Paramyrothecium foliicola]
MTGSASFFLPGLFPGLTIFYRLLGDPRSFRAFWRVTPSLTKDEMHIAEEAIPAIISLSVFAALSLIIVSLRIYTRVFLVKNPGADDALIAGSMALWSSIPLYNASLSMCKLSIALQYYRVFRTATMQKIIKAIIVLLVIYSMWSILGTVLTCVPVSKWWTPTKEGKCFDRNIINYVNAGINIFTDLIMLAIPIPLLHKLQISRKQKFILVGVFACGGLACIMSIIRIHSLYQIGVAPPAKQSEVEGVNIAIWSGIEIYVGIMCASVPALKALGVRLIPKLLLSNLYARSRTPGGGRYVRQKNPSGDDSRHPSRTAGISSTETATSAKAQITIEQSFEMSTIRAEEMDLSRRNGTGQESGLEVSCYAPGVLKNEVP